MDQLKDFLTKHPHIHHADPLSPDFESLRGAFVINTTIPALIVRPRSAEDVAGLVKVLKETNLPFSIRVGGHDMFGRSQVQDAVTIDLREIAHIHVDRDNGTARLGGGVLFADLLKELDRQEMAVPHPLVASVGYVGWATHGGYGILTPQYGLGAGQILQATVVDAQGDVRDADNDMLTAIRGGGGAVAVVVEVTIKVYPLGQVLAGIIMYDSSDMSATIERYNDAYRQQMEEGLPLELNLSQSVINGPTGKTLAVFFVWASVDVNAGQTWLTKVSKWSPVAMNTVSTTTVAAFHEILQSILPASVYGKSLTVTLRELTPEVVKVLAKHAQLLPSDPPTMIGMHELRVGAPEPSNSVLGTRCPHFVLEILPMVADRDRLDEVLSWGQGFYEDMTRTDSNNILPSTFLPLTEPSKVNMKGIYGVNYEVLKQIKDAFDPQNVFKHALVQL